MKNLVSLFLKSYNFLNVLHLNHNGHIQLEKYNCYFQSYFRCNNDAQLFHHVEWLPGNAARRFELDCHERMGRRMHVLHLRESSRVRLCELRWSQTADAQRCLSSGRESRHPGTLLINIFSIILSDA